MENNEPNQLPPTPPINEKPVENKKMVAGLCALLVGAFGVHKFVLGYTTEGILLLVANLVVVPIIGVVTCGIGFGLYAVTSTIPLIEGIIYLTKTDEQFYETYQKNKKAWF